MGYAKLVQYGETTEYYKYDKQVNTRRRRILSALQRKRLSQRRKTSIKSKYSIDRARANFFKLVTHQLHVGGRCSLVTLTNYQADVHLSEGYKSISKFKYYVKSKMGKTIAYIAVPEWTKAGRLHFHLLVWGLTEKETTSERDTRNLQRCYAKGYLDVRYSYDSSKKLASYLAKYMQKAIGNKQLANKKAYSCTRNIERFTKAGFNGLSAYESELLPSSEHITKIIQYDTKWLGKCVLTIYEKTSTIES